MTELLIKSGQLIDPALGTEAVKDILIKDGKIIKVGTQRDASVPNIDAKGKWVLPGLIDMHCHLRDPGNPEDETIASGTRSAAKGGFTSIACMANTDPPIDTPAMIKYVVSKAQHEGVVNVLPIGAVTKGLAGDELTEMGRMIEEGAVAFSNDGQPITNSQTMRVALEYARQFGVPIIAHCEDPGLSKDGQMHEGYYSTILGLPGIPAASEEIVVERDLRLAELFGSLHIAHVSTRGSVELIRQAKKRGIKITCETCPHYFTLTEAEVEGYDTRTKVKPPLRTEEDRLAVIAGLKDGTIDVIATDHAPHRIERKYLEYGLAAFGMVGFETALSLALVELVEKAKIPLIEVIRKMTVNPARILDLKDKGQIKAGMDADLIIVDPKAINKIDIDEFVSKSKNSPFDGLRLVGKVIYTIVGGKVILSNGKLLS